MLKSRISKILLLVLAAVLVALAFGTRYFLSKDADSLPDNSLISNIKTFAKNTFSSQYFVSAPKEEPPAQISLPEKTISPSTTSASALLWGAYPGDQPSDGPDFETRVGKKMNLQAVFINMGLDPFPSQFSPTIKDEGKTMIIFWEPYDFSLDDIIAGKVDTYIRRFAQAAKKYNGPIILVPFHEMNGDWSPWSGTLGTNTPEKVIEAWKHIHALFTEAPNVAFGWAVNHESVPDTPANQIENYWPGSDYVDYVGVDGFNFADPWQSFEQIFDEALGKLAIYGKPIYIFSFASAEGPAKAGWIADALTLQIPKHSLIAGWVWFNQNKEKDWRVWSDEDSLAAFKNNLP